MFRTIHILGILSALNLIVAGLLWYGYGNMQTIKNSEFKLRSDIAIEDQKGQQLAALEKTLASAEADRKVLEQYLYDPSDESQILLVSQLEHLGLPTTGAQVLVTSVDLRPTPPSLHSELTISGTWPQLFHLLRLVETLPTRTSVANFSISRSTPPGALTSVSSPSSPWVGTLSLDITSLKGRFPTK